MKITEFALTSCFDTYLDYYVHFKFSYGDGNHGDFSMPHYDELIEILEYRFEPAFSEGCFPENISFENYIMDNQGDWFSLED